MKLLIQDLNKLPKLAVGFIIMAFGIMLIKRSDLGLFPWGVFHDGIAMNSIFTFGQVIQLLGLVILLFSVLAFKTNIGFGTIINIVLVGWLIDYSGSLFIYEPSSVIMEITLFLSGFVLMNIGRAFYISAKLGAGPRDGMFVGLSRLTKIDVMFVKPGIEIVVLIIGVLLGAKIGFGTVFLMVFSGFMVQVFFKLFNYDPKEERQRSITEYLRLEEKDTI